MNQDIKAKAQKADKIVFDCDSKLHSISKKQNDVIGNYYKSVGSQKMEKIKKEIEAL